MLSSALNVNADTTDALPSPLDGDAAGGFESPRETGGCLEPLKSASSSFLTDPSSPAFIKTAA